MTTLRRQIPELSAYHDAPRGRFPWAAVNWANVYIGAGLGGLICLIVFLAILGWTA